MIEAGRAALAFALGANVLGLLLAWRARNGEGRSTAAAGRAQEATFLGILAAVLLLEVLLHARDFRLAYVWQYTSSTLPSLYTTAALWAGQSGSILFFTLLLSGYGVVARRFSLYDRGDLVPGFLLSYGVIQLFFLVILTGFENPFATHWDLQPRTPPIVPNDGMGLNPLLQHPAMAIHPPILYLGYTGTAVPFAIALSALAHGRLGETWVRSVRRFVLFAWLFLGVGMLLGGRWAYEELGWGGYWAWDPVENAALVPFLVATAFLHSVMIEERRGMLRIWNLVLVVLFFLTAIFGTFLTRTGLVTSVHAFAQSDIMPPLLALLVVATVASVALLAKRLPQLRSRERIRSLASREAAFLFNNCLLLAMAFAVLWGTLFPVLSKAATGAEISVGPPFYNRIVLPMGASLLYLAGIGTLVAWRKTSGARLGRAVGLPFVAAVLAAGLSAAVGARGWLSIATIGGAAFLLAATILDTGAALRIRRTAGGGPWDLFRSNPRRYGGYVVHLGFALLALGIVGNAHQSKTSLTLAPGETSTYGPWRFHLREVTEDADAHRDEVAARIAVEGVFGGTAEMAPRVLLFFAGTDREQPLTEPAILHQPWGELYLVLLSAARDKASVEVYVNPLIHLFFGGGALMAFGTLLGLLPPRVAAPTTGTT